MRIGGRVDGVEELNRLLREIPERAEAVLRRSVKRSLMNIEAGAKRRCSVRTGRLRNSITYQVDEGGLDGAVGTDVEYAPHVHFGTGAAGQASAGEFGFTGGAYDQSFTGQPANPFLYLAAVEERPKFIAETARDLTAALERMARR